MPEENGAAPVACKCIVHRSLERLKPGKACGQSLAQRSTLASPSGSAKKSSPGPSPQEAAPEAEEAAPEAEETAEEAAPEAEETAPEAEETAEEAASGAEETAAAPDPGQLTNLFCIKIM